MSDLRGSVLYISNTVPQNGEQFHPDPYNIIKTLQEFDKSNEIYVTIQIEHPDEDKQNNTSGSDRTVNDVFKS